MIPFKAYKVFDENWKCQNYDFKDHMGNVIGTVHSQDNEIKLCSIGFHFCRKLTNCFNYKKFDSKNKVAEIEILGVCEGDPEDKECTAKFKIIKELSWEEVLRICNSGDGNSGNGNSGDGNSGNGNSGDRNSGNGNSGYGNSGYGNSGNGNSGNGNSGDRNSGNGNSGYGNSGNRNSGDGNSGYGNSGYGNSGYGNSGCFNSMSPDKFLVFNKWVSKEEFDAIGIPRFFYFDLITFVGYDVASPEEQDSHKKDIEAFGGFYKTMSYKEAFRLSYKNAIESDRNKIKKIIGFDKNIFFEISGIDVDKD
jgi:hypothetical protein